jgi:hypothetical protein
MSIKDTIKQSSLNYQGNQPPSQAIVPDTLNNQSSIWGTPGFGTYAAAWLRKLKPTKLAAPRNPTKYLDNKPN